MFLPPSRPFRDCVLFVLGFWMANPSISETSDELANHRLPDMS